MVAAYDEAAATPVVTKFVDGIFQDNWTANQGLDNARRALLPVAYLFADGTPTDERREMWVKTVQIRSGKMSNSDIIALGAPSGTGMPLTVSPPPPSINMMPNVGGKLILLWPLSVSGFTLESSSTVTAGWTAVPGVVNNAIEVTIGPGNQFFRLKKN